MNDKTELNLEFQQLQDAYLEAMRLVKKGEVSAAYAALLQLPQPETEEGRELMARIRVIQLFIRALKLLHEQGEATEIESLLKQFLQKSADDEVYSSFRTGATGLLLLVTLGPAGLTQLTEEQQEQLERAGLTQVIYQAKAQEDALEEFKEAITALRAGHEDEFANKLARAEALYRRAAEENPKVRDLIRSYWLSIELMVLLEQQGEALSEFDFERVQGMTALVEQKVTELEQTHANSNIKKMIEWVPQVGKVYRDLSLAFADLAKLLKELMGGQVQAKHSKKLEELGKQLRKIREQITKVQGPGSMIETVREQALAVSSKGLQLISNIRVGLHPSRKLALNIAGIATAFGFLIVVALLFLIGNLFGITLSPALVLMLGAFFGLVTGFGYGAMKFQNFFDLIFFGRGKGDGDSKKGEAIAST
jgi:hypothetical protein